ncbi:mucin-5AC [Coregonus clupeaformis]|uniref:mucin-5AC n=1 Tax=Coregonus clupeaformis TaxID=59861 RepID=UPI001E1C3C79|nr:mucin-5AC [Coregonus clupeaformis]
MSSSQSSLPLLLLMMVSSSWASHFLGGTMTFNPRGTNPDGTFRVDLRYKTAFHSSGCFTDTWNCVSGDCGNETSLVVKAVSQDISEGWCQTEGVMTRHVSNNIQTFDLQLDGYCWVFNDNSVNSWRLLTHVDLGVRSDTGKVNRSPQTTVIPLMSVPVNCQRDFNLLSFDPDGDMVRCRYAVPTDECATSSNLPNDFSLRGDCTLSFWGNRNTTGTYAVQMMMEDFPTQSISLSYTNGSQSNRTSNNTLSKLPVQFAVRVDPPVPSCMEGLYLPMFLSPTPAQGALLYASVNQPLEITVRAQATQSTVSELLVSGPSTITKNTTVPGEYLLRWTPTEDEERGYYPVCFIARGANNSSKYHSELRCVIVSVGNTSAIRTTQNATAPPTTTQPTTELTTAPTNFSTQATTTTTEPTPTTVNISNTVNTTIIVNTSNTVNKPITVNTTIIVNTLNTVNKPITVNTSNTVNKPITVNTTIIVNTLNTVNKPITANATIIVNKPITANTTIIVNTLNTVNKPITANASNTVNTPITVNTSNTVNTPITVNASNTVNTPITVNASNTVNTPITVNASNTVNTPITVNASNTVNTPITVNTSNTVNTLNTVNASNTVNTPITVNTSNTVNKPITVNTSNTVNTPITVNTSNTVNTTTTMTTTLSTNPTTNLTTNNVVNTLNIIGPRYIVGLRIKLSSLITLTDDYIRNVVLQQLREELIRRELPGNFTLRLRATYEISP